MNAHWNPKGVKFELQIGSTQTQIQGIHHGHATQTMTTFGVSLYVVIE